jgi:transcription initiation factor IIE alpha subunit
MKLEFVCNGEEFDIPKKPITVEDEIEILEYIDKNLKDKPDLVKRLNELTYAIYLVLRKIDDKVTFENVKNNLSMEETGSINLLFRTKGQLEYDCPHCGKQFKYMDLVKKEDGGDKSFQKHHQPPGTMKMKKTT